MICWVKVMSNGLESWPWSDPHSAAFFGSWHSKRIELRVNGIWWRPYMQGRGR